MRELTNKQERFVEEYLLDLNATRAAIRAGYSRETAGVIGYENLKKPYISNEIGKAMEKRSKRTKVTVDRVLLELARIAFFDTRKLFADQGDLIDVRELPADTAAAIANVDITSFMNETGDVTTVSKFKILDKLRALELVGRHLKMFTDKIQVDGNLALSQIVQEIQGQERAAILPPPEADGS